MTKSITELTAAIYEWKTNDIEGYDEMLWRDFPQLMEYVRLTFRAEQLLADIAIDPRRNDLPWETN